MKPIILQLFILFLFVSGCKERSPEDYHYYKPYQKKVVKDTLSETNVAIDSVKTESTVKPPIEQLAKKGVSLDDHYFIVVASYVVKEYADAQKQRLQEMGFKPELLMVNDDGWYKLAVLSYKSLAEAEAELKTMIDKKVLSPDSRIVFRNSKE